MSAQWQAVHASHKKSCFFHRLHQLCIYDKVNEKRDNKRKLFTGVIHDSNEISPTRDRMCRSGHGAASQPSKSQRPYSDCQIFLHT
jgi:hypothetical protein